ncbi:type I DNA topoisomerase, partial [bacterium]
MATKLVIVESPAKARTIGSYLGDDYEVQASIGHIRDLANKSTGLPEDKRKEWWAQYAVDVDHGFEPYYEVPPDKAAQVSKLRAALKGKDELILATDEDREGEAISWHLLQALKPAKSVAIKRIAFHEITRDAIRRALESPRQVDTDLVEAQETRRILDRLYGYTLSPVLWAKVMRNLSAGRVQSPAVKLIVEREYARRDFKSAIYWGLRAEYLSGKESFFADLRRIDGVRLANGSDFGDTTGQLKSPDKVRLLNGEQANAIARAALPARPHRLVSLKTREAQEKPAPPFMTTTLQQDANRKLGFGAERTMRAAQGLYEGVNIGGETVGLITYMRTDSLSLSSEAVNSIRDHIGKTYPNALPDKPNVYTSKVKNAQEAHEAIRPTDAARTPEKMAQFLSDDQRRVYTLIWQRAVASQMKPAKVLRTEAEIEVSIAHELGDQLTFGATGRQIVEPGYLAVYAVSTDDEEEGEGRLPRLTEGQDVEPKGFDARESATKPPPRYNDATLIKALEERGIGRPSTYASIISVIQDRGYARKEGKTLIPSFKACMTMDVLETGFSELVDLGFTARMDEALDEIAGGRSNSTDYLQEFFFGTDAHLGLHPLVQERKAEIPFPVFLVGQ